MLLKKILTIFLEDKDSFFHCKALSDMFKTHEKLQNVDGRLKHALMLT